MDNTEIVNAIIPTNVKQELQYDTEQNPSDEASSSTEVVLSVKQECEDIQVKEESQEPKYINTQDLLDIGETVITEQDRIAPATSSTGVPSKVMNSKQKGRQLKFIHTKEPYKCEVCDYKCNRKCQLKTHMTTHIGEKRYKGEVCDHKCNRKSNLKTHMRTHTGEKRYKCIVCDYKCNQKLLLNSHMVTHIG